MVRLLHMKWFCIFVGTLAIITPYTHAMEPEDPYQNIPPIPGLPSGPPPPYDEEIPQKPAPHHHARKSKTPSVEVRCSGNVIITGVFICVCYGAYRFAIHVYEKNNPQKISKDELDDTDDELDPTDPSNATTDQRPALALVRRVIVAAVQKAKHVAFETAQAVQKVFYSQQ